MTPPVKPELTQTQRADLAEVFAGYLAPGNIKWLAERTVGRETAKDVGDEVGDVKALARAVVELLAKEGRIADAVTVLSLESVEDRRFVNLLTYILQGGGLHDKDTHQKFLKDVDQFIDPSAVERVRATICAIALGSPHEAILGTGFLIGPDLVMTNFHVIEDYLERNGDGTFRQTPDGSYCPSKEGDHIFFFFDYRSLPTPVVPSQAAKATDDTEYVTGAKNWLECARPFLANEGKPDCPGPTNKEFDYAIIRLAKRVGNKPARRSGGPPRGWLDLPAKQINPLANQTVMVLQHPSAQPQALGFGNFHGLDVSTTRLRYDVSTAKGSSGGPAVDRSGKLLALHNSTVSDQPLNQGVRIDRIREDVFEQKPDVLTLDAMAAPTDFWSLSETLKDPRPVIGRGSFRANVVKMMDPKGPRIMHVTGVPYGVQFSVKVLRRTLGSRTPVVQFNAADIANPDSTPRQFLRIVAAQIGLAGTDIDPIPEEQPSETVARGVRRDMYVWLARRLAATAQADSSRFPAWIVINTVQGAGQQLLWAPNLRECITALASAPEEGQSQVDLPQLRWLFLGAAPDGLHVANDNRLRDELSNAELEEEFAECAGLAISAADKDAGLTPDQWARMARNLVNTVPPEAQRKRLADLIRDMVRV